MFCRKPRQHTARDSPRGVCHSQIPHARSAGTALEVMHRDTEAYGIELILSSIPFHRNIDEYTTSYHKNNFNYHNHLNRMKHSINNSTQHFAREHRLTCIDT